MARAPKKPVQGTENVQRKRAPRKPTAIVHKSTSVSFGIEKGFLDIRKPVDSIMMSNRTNSTITLIERKAINNILGFAQKISRENPELDRDTYQLPLADFESVMGLTTNNRPHLIKTLSAIQEMKVEFNFGRRNKRLRNGSAEDSDQDGEEEEGLWGIANIVSEIYLDPKTKTILFSLPPKAKKILLEPAHFNHIQSLVQNQFSSHAALVLYEFVSTHFTSPAKRTPMMKWEELSVAMSGARQPHKLFRDFNKMLVRAVESVNAIANDQGYNIIVHRMLENRWTTGVWFEIENIRQASLGFEGSPILVGGELREKMAHLGLTDSEMTDLVLRYGEEYVLAQFDYTDRRMKSKKLGKVDNPKAYFKSCIDKNAADAPRIDQDEIKRKAVVKKEEKTEADAKAPSRNSKKMTNDLMEAWKRSKRQEIKDRFDAQDESMQQEIVAGITDKLKTAGGTAVWNAYKKQGLKPALVRTAIVDIIFEENVSEPTAEELIAFAVENNLLSIAAK